MQCINVTVHSLVCMACSDILQEILHTITGIQHSSFTPEEAATLQQMNTTRVNQVYLAANVLQSPSACRHSCKQV
jgi:hypothetical protein